MDQIKRVQKEYQALYREHNLEKRGILHTIFKETLRRLNSTCIVYGGVALDLQLSALDTIYPSGEMYDIDVMTTDSNRLIKELGSAFAKQGIILQHSPAIHPGTTNLFSLGMNIGDATQYDPSLFKLYKKRSKVVDGIRVISDIDLSIGFSDILSQPVHSHRWEKTYSRMLKHISLFGHRKTPDNLYMTTDKDFRARAKTVRSKLSREGLVVGGRITTKGSLPFVTAYTDDVAAARRMYGGDYTAVRTGNKNMPMVGFCMMDDVPVIIFNLDSETCASYYIHTSTRDKMKHATVFTEMTYLGTLIYNSPKKLPASIEKYRSSIIHYIDSLILCARSQQNIKKFSLQCMGPKIGVFTAKLRR